jgi:hypothetical protein
MSFNPYQPPTSAYDGNQTNYGNYGTGATVSDATVAALRKTRPWVMLIGVLGLVFSGLGLLGGLISLTEGTEGLIMILMMAIYLAPSLMLVRYGSAINRLLHGGGVVELEKSLDSQATFWQIAGIFTIVSIVAVIGLTVIGITAFSQF